ncbi:hypothetical protein BJX61DRAFT_549496 [Aspergillus egyptiacus]|nr:hypothetical protein BJX61DRAFT_549496 [Aspergillus egyptiacus]
MERINQICDAFSARLDGVRERNYEERPFYPNGIARDVLRMEKESLHELFQTLLILDRQTAEVVPGLVHRVVRHLSTTFAVIVRIRPANNIRILQRFIDLLISDNSLYEPPRLTDDNLPLPLSEARFFFFDHGNEFFDAQFQFCAITLKSREHLVYRDDYRSQCPLPYKKQERIGSGAYGQVYKVKIECRHFRLAGDTTGNFDPVWLARKDFRSHQAFESELDVFKDIMKQPQKHDNLVKVLAILQYGDTNSLFFPLASCDLHQYLNGEIRPNQPAPGTLDQKKAIFSRGVALAGALAFLHGGFDGKVYLHLDLKPRNVLVYDAYNQDKEIWKITDFGLTRVRDPEHSSVAPGFEGTYLPPECATAGGKVTTQSDVWSLGCIFSLIVTYMLYGPTGVRKFAAKRMRPEGDSFYALAKNGVPFLPLGVTSWFDEMKQSTPSYEMEYRVVRESLEYLQRKVLLPIRDQRAYAKDVERALKKVQQHFRQETPPPSPDSSNVPQRRDSIHRGLFGIFKRRPSAEPPVWRLQGFGFDLDTNGLGFRFSALDGDFLTFFSTQRMLLWSISEITSALDDGAQIPRPQSVPVSDGIIKCFAVSSRSICSCLHADSFLCYIYHVEGPLSAARIQDGVKISYNHMGPIRKVTMSSDGSRSAFVLTERSRVSESGCLIYVASTQQLINTADGENNPTIPCSSRSNSVSESSSISVTSAANFIENPGVKSPAEILFVEFTPNAKFLVIVTQNLLGTFSIRVWDADNGKCYRDFSVTIEPSQTLPSLFTGCCLFISRNAEPCLAILVDHQRIIHIDLFHETFNDQKLDISVERMFVCDGGLNLILIGKNKGLWAYFLAFQALEKPKPVRLARIDRLSYAPALDDVAVRRYAAGQARLLIASSSGSFFETSLHF